MITVFKPQKIKMGPQMQLKHGTAFMILTMAFTQAVSAGSIDDYGGFGKYKRSPIF